MENIEKLLEKYQAIRDYKNASSFLNFIIGWDSQTQAPQGCFEQRSKQMETISEWEYSFMMNEENVAVINQLYENREKLDDVTKHEIIEMKKSHDKMSKYPVEFYVELIGLLTQSENTWANAKNNNDFQLFLPTLEKIIMMMRQYVKYLETDDIKGYDILLDEYEHGMNREKYDNFFNLLKEKLVPFVKKVINKKLSFNNEFLSHKYPKEKQKEICEELQKVMCFDRNRGCMMESEHPFTSNFGPNDVRFTVHYYEDLPLSSIFSAVHELGHALYEQNVSQSLNGTCSGGGASMAMHESQSRFFENIIGRTKEFWIPLWDLLKKTYPSQLANTTVDDFYCAINQAEASLIRTEADELTYPIHIMIRYEIEKDLFDGKIEAKDLPSVWNKAVKDYLGLEVKNDSEGVLQDVHWAGGSFGYFPTYALGSAYAAQIYHAMKKDIDIASSLLSGSTQAINEWLKNHIHQYGSSKYPLELLKEATNEEFNPQYYIDYLIEKYQKIYKLD